MTVFARSDFQKYAGPCGRVHERPVVSGEPVTVWALACPMCELELASDPGWSVHPELIPRTADEERRASKLAEEGTSTMHKVAEALALNAAKILNEQQSEQAGRAAVMARHAAAAEAELTAAAADRARQEQEARLAEATRVAAATVHVVTPATASHATGKPVVVAPQEVAKGEPSFPAEVHPSRKCTRCSGQLTRKAHATGRWPSLCLECRSAKE